MKDVQRLDKLLSSQGAPFGIAGRSEAQRLVRSGRVAVDGTPVRDPAAKVSPAGQRVEVDGRPLTYKEHVYIMCNKPPGLLCVSRDPRAPTVIDLVPPELRRRGLFPAGRLDKDTVGLVLITDDGDFAHRLLSPRKKIFKTYQAVVDGPVTPAHEAAFAEGTSLEDGTRCLPAFLRVLREGEQPLTEIRIAEGKYHQIKRMFQSVGRNVLWLKRISMGGLALDPGLEEGKCREITQEEKDAILE